ICLKSSGLTTISKAFLNNCRSRKSHLQSMRGIMAPPFAGIALCLFSSAMPPVRLRKSSTKFSYRPTTLIYDCHYQRKGDHVRVAFRAKTNDRNRQHHLEYG